MVRKITKEEKEKAKEVAKKVGKVGLEIAKEYIGIQGNPHEYGNEVEQCRKDNKMACEALLNITQIVKKPEKLLGGYADNLPDEQFDRTQLIKGIQVELEHTDDPYIAKEIAKDHLTEHHKYYDYLEKMEEEWEK